MSQFRRHEHEIDAYWQRDAARAYAERVRSVRAALFDNGGVVLPWMRFSIGSRDLNAALEGASHDRD